VLVTYDPLLSPRRRVELDVSPMVTSFQFFLSGFHRALFVYGFGSLFRWFSSPPAPTFIFFANEKRNTFFCVLPSVELVSLSTFFSHAPLPDLIVPLGFGRSFCVGLFFVSFCVSLFSLVGLWNSFFCFSDCYFFLFIFFLLLPYPGPTLQRRTELPSERRG